MIVASIAALLFMTGNCSDDIQPPKDTQFENRFGPADPSLAAANKLFDAKQYAQALPLYQSAADSNQPFAMRRVGAFYETGTVVTQDYAKAMQWYQKAASAGDPTAITDIGRLYDNGRGVPQNYSEALTWYRKGAAAGDVKAINNVGVMYALGQGVTLNYT